MQGKKLVFVTNNSTKSRAGYLSKFKKLGLNVTAVSSLFLYHTAFKLFLTFHCSTALTGLGCLCNCYMCSCLLYVLKQDALTWHAVLPGVHADRVFVCLQEEIYSSSYAAAAYLESIHFPKDKKVSQTWNITTLSAHKGCTQAGLTRPLAVTCSFYLPGPGDCQ